MADLAVDPDIRDRLDDSLTTIHRARLAGIADGTWPTTSLDVWLGLAAQADEHVAAGRPIDDTLQRALDVAATHRKAARIA